MSTASKVTLLCASVVSCSIIAYVHFKQMWDRQSMHEGVIKDIERQQRRKVENIYNLQQQIELSRELKRSQYSDGT